MTDKIYCSVNKNCLNYSLIHFNMFNFKSVLAFTKFFIIYCADDIMLAIIIIIS